MDAWVSHRYDGVDNHTLLPDTGAFWFDRDKDSGLTDAQRSAN